MANPPTRWSAPALKSNHTVVDLSKTGAKTIWQFDKDEDVLFIASDETRTLDRLQTTGGNNIVLMGGKFEPHTHGSAAGTLNFTKVSGAVHVEGVHIDHRHAGGKDAINFYSAAGKGADFSLQNSLIENIKGTYGGTHGDVFQPQGPVGDLKFFNVTATTNYQGLFLQPKHAIKSVTLENVEMKKIAGGDPSSFLYYFAQPGDDKYPVSLKNVYVTEQSGRPAEYNAVYPSTWVNGAERDGAVITFPNHPYSGSIKIGTAGFMTAGEVGANYDHPGFGHAELAASGSARGDAGADVIRDGGGDGIVDYSWVRAPVAVDLAAGKASGGSGADRLSGIDDVIGSSRSDSLAGNRDANTLVGGGGNDTLKGGAGADHLVGGAGSDTLDSGAGSDRMIGGTGNDTYIVNAAGDRIEEHAGQGTDSIKASVSWTLSPNLENLTFTGAGALTGRGNTADNVIRGGSGTDALHGLGGDDELVGGAGNDHLYGGGGSDLHKGGAGKDIIKGDAGNDVLAGGAGQDRLYGGSGSDRFVFTGLGDSKPGWGQRDSILDLSSSDRIDLSGIDANTTAGGNQAFTLIGSKSFGDVAGQLRWSDAGGFRVVQGDATGDGVSDFEIQIAGNPALNTSMFLL